MKCRRHHTAAQAAPAIRAESHSDEDLFERLRASLQLVERFRAEARLPTAVLARQARAQAVGRAELALRSAQEVMDELAAATAGERTMVDISRAAGVGR